MKLPFLAIALMACCIGTGCAAAEEMARKYAVLSLIGDSISVVTYQGSTASRLDRNTADTLPIADRVFDRAALAATEEAVKRTDPRSSVLLLAASSPGLFSDQDRFFDRTRLVLPDALVAMMQKENATHLLLLTKHRGEARLQAQDQKIGSGVLSGLGFYIDRRIRTRNADTGEVGQGFLAPFVYVQVSLIDLATFTVSRQETITATATLSAAMSKASPDPWDALDASQKAELLRRMVSRELLRVVASLVMVPEKPRESRN